MHDPKAMEPTPTNPPPADSAESATPSSTHQPPAPGVGQVVNLPAGPRYGRFAVQRFHAKGGLGEVHLAIDEELKRSVALKRMQDRFADDVAAKRRFLNEAEITAKLEHPGIVPIYGLVQDEHGQPCYAMRFIEGESLGDAIKRWHGLASPVALAPGVLTQVNLGALTQPRSHRITRRIAGRASC